MARKFADNPYYVEYERLLRELNQLMAAGKGDTEAADALREEMDGLWRELSREEIDRLNGLSADFYMLQGNEVFECVEPAERMPEQLGPAIAATLKQKDWERVLALLRRGPTFLSQDRVASLRAKAYEELGHVDTALLFAEYAATVNPHEPTYSWRTMELLMRLGRYDQARVAAEAHIADKESAPVILIQSAAILLISTRGLPDDQASPFFERALEALERALLVEQTSPTLNPFAIAYGYVTKGFCYEALGMPDQALDAYNAALKVQPDDPLALVARGLLRARTSPEDAVGDFERAVATNVLMVAPYIHLAHRSLLRGDYWRCLEFCNRLLSMTRNPRLLATVLQWAAIAQFELGVSPDIVRSNFETALRLDPDNEQVQQNFARFEQLLQSDLSIIEKAGRWQSIESLDLKEAYPKYHDILPLAQAA